MMHPFKLPSIRSSNPVYELTCLQPVEASGASGLTGTVREGGGLRWNPD